MDEQTEKDIAATDYLAKNAHRLIPKMMKLYSRMDRRCQQMCRSNSKRPMTDYCEKCQDMFKKELENDIK